MKTNVNKFAVRISVLAVQGALISLAVLPAVGRAEEDATVASLTTPTNTVEIGAAYTWPINTDNRGSVNNSNGNNTSYKAGEYNGLQDKGTTAIGAFDLRGGGAYDSGRCHSVESHGDESRP